MHSNFLSGPGVLAILHHHQAIHTLGRKVGLDEDAVNIVWKRMVRVEAVQDIFCPFDPFLISPSESKPICNTFRKGKLGQRNWRRSPRWMFFTTAVSSASFCMLRVRQYLLGSKFEGANLSRLMQIFSLTVPSIGFGIFLNYQLASMEVCCVISLLKLLTISDGQSSKQNKRIS